MTIGQLIVACDNILPHTKLMIFDSVWDFDNFTSNWETCNADTLYNSVASSSPIARFHIYSDFVAIALA